MTQEHTTGSNRKKKNRVGEVALEDGGSVGEGRSGGSRRPAKWIPLGMGFPRRGDGARDDRGGGGGARAVCDADDGVTPWGN